MIFSYDGYSTMVIENIDAALGREAQLLIFFLFSSFDASYQAELKRLAADIDALTGKHCAAIVFAPPSPKKRLRAESLRAYANRADEPALWAGINQKMTENAYEIADAFEISRDSLPAILFVARNSEICAHISMRELSLDEFYRGFRNIVSNWYEQNRSVFSLEDRILHNFYLLEFLPNIKSSLAQSGMPAEDIEKATKLAHRLGRHPQEFSTLVRFMQSKGVPLEHAGTLLSEKNFLSYVQNTVKKKVDAQKVEPIVFPIQAIESVDRRVKVASIYSFAKRASKEMAEWVRRLVPFAQSIQISNQIIKDVTVHGSLTQTSRQSTGGFGTAEHE